MVDIDDDTYYSETEVPSLCLDCDGDGMVPDPSGEPGEVIVCNTCGGRCR